MTTAADIWNGLLAQTTFTGRVPDGPRRAAVQEFVAGFPAAFGALFPEKLTAETLARTAYAILLHSRNTGYVTRQCAAARASGASIPPNMVQELQNAETAQLKTLQHLVKGLDEGDDHAWKMLRRVEYVLRRLTGLAAAEYEAGTLTVGRLLVLDLQAVMSVGDNL
ncbi:MAG: hypothetical protein RLZZ324_1281 [Candidatus Parcubacteria bacterium]|jgi:hypothetical protein